MFHAVERLYSYILLLKFPTTYIFSPSDLKNKPVGSMVCVAIEKLWKSTAVAIFQALDKLYSNTRSDVLPIIYIFKPLGLKNIPSGEGSCAFTLLVFASTAVVTFHAVIIHSPQMMIQFQLYHQPLILLQFPHLSTLLQTHL